MIFEPTNSEGREINDKIYAKMRLRCVSPFCKYSMKNLILHFLPSEGMAVV